jgi:hypothetical protein
MQFVSKRHNLEFSLTATKLIPAPAVLMVHNRSLYHVTYLCSLFYLKYIAAMFWYKYLCFI